MEKKKDYSLLKIVFIPVLLYLVLTWFIPVGNFTGSEVTLGETNPLGLHGLFQAPFDSLSIFTDYIILVLCIGGFYGILNKTGAYQRIVDFFASKNKTSFLVVTVSIFAVLSSVFGETMLAFVLLPFFASVLFKLGYDKVSCMAATIGASLVGMVSSVMGNMLIYKQFNFDLKIFILFNIIMLLIFIFLLCMLIVSKNSKSLSKFEKVKDIPLYENVKGSKKSIVPLVIVLSIVLLLIIVGQYSWYYSFNLQIFNNLYEKISSIELFGINIFSKILGDFPVIGMFSNNNVSVTLLISSLLIGWVYSIKFSDIIDGFKNGAKVMLIPGLYIILANAIFANIYMTSGNNISVTISSYVLKLFSDFNIFTGSVAAIFGSIFYNDYLYFLYDIRNLISLYNTSMMPLIMNVFQTMFNIMKLVLPVSIILIGGLKYLNVSYKEWIKYMWKFLIQLFIISTIGNIILSMVI